MIKACAICGAEFVAQRSTAKYCSERCRQRAFRNGGVPFTGELAPVPVRVGMSESDVREVVVRAHDVASDLSRASMLTPAPLCLSLKHVGVKLADALRDEGL